MTYEDREWAERMAIPPAGSVEAIALARQLDPGAYAIVDACQFWDPKGAVATVPLRLLRAANSCRRDGIVNPTKAHVRKRIEEAS